MSVSVINPQRPQDPLERVANAVQIARTVYGIYSDSKALDAAKQKQENFIKQQDVENKRSDEELGIKKAIMLQNQKDAQQERQLRGLNIKKIEQELTEGPKPTAEQAKDAIFTKRMQQAEDVFSNLGAAGDSGSGILNSIQRMDYFPGSLQSEKFKKRDQAERNFINAVLRKESGAAISPAEFESAAIQYFPRPGDTPDVLKQKEENRRVVIEGFAASAGDRAIGRIENRLADGQSKKPQITAGGVPVADKDLQKKALEILQQRSMKAQR